jgi:hypothetical protein
VTGHAGTASVLTLENFLLDQSSGESFVDVFGFKRGLVKIIEPPIGCLTHDGRAIVMTYFVAGEAVRTAVLEDPLPDFVEHEAETDGVRESKGLDMPE